MSDQKNMDDSEFYMWRCIIVMIHADNVVMPQELFFVNNYLKNSNLSDEQLLIIEDDFKNPKEPYGLFKKITNAQDRKNFFVLARAISWCDGDFVEQEKYIISFLEESHLSDKNLSYLKETRNTVNEVDLCQNQWRFKTGTGKNIFSFLEQDKEEMS